MSEPEKRCGFFSLAWRSQRVVGLSVGATLLLITVWAYSAFPEHRAGWMGNPAAFCHNCGGFISMALRFYAHDHDDSLPRGAATPLDSLAVLMTKYDVRPSQMTSHAWSRDLSKFYKKSNRLAPEFCAYRYNEGLRADDGEEYIFLYFHKASYWISHSAKGNVIGRQVLSGSMMTWDFIPEPEFQRRQSNTVALLEKRHRLAPEIDRITSSLVLGVDQEKLSSGAIRFSTRIRNTGTNAVSLTLLRMGKLRFTFGSESHDDAFIERQRAELLLPPGQTHQFPGWAEVTSASETDPARAAPAQVAIRYATGPKNADGEEGVITTHLSAVADGSSPGKAAAGSVRAMLLVEIRSPHLQGIPISLESAPVTVEAPLTLVPQ